MSTIPLFLIVLGVAGPLTAERPDADLGEIKAGPALAHRFRLVNAGPKPVNITGASASCGCMTPKVSRNPVPAGESADLELDIRTITQPAGPARWTVRVAYRAGGGDPEELALQLTARLVREVGVEPAMLAVTSDKAGSYDLVVTDRRAGPLAVTRAATGLPWLAAAVGGPAKGDDGVWRRAVTLTVPADAPPGRHDTELVLTTADAAYPELRVPVRVTRRPPAAGVSAAPDRVSLLATASDRAPSRLVQLRDRSGGPVEVESASCDVPGVECKWAAGPHPVSTLRVTLATPPAGAAGGHLTVRFRQPAGAELRVPVAATGE